MWWIVCNCAKNEWIGDGFCDDGTEYNIDLSCGTYNNDEGDCASGAAPGASSCESGKVKDCNGSCQNASWIGDGVCDDGSQYSAVFTCASNQDGGLLMPIPQPRRLREGPSYFYQYANQYLLGRVARIPPWRCC